MLKRVISAAILAPIFIALILLGGYWLLGTVLLICGISAWEFGRLYDHTTEFRIPLILLILCVEVLILARWTFGIGASHRALTFCIMSALVWGVVACEQGLPKPAISFAVLTTGMVYVGWLGGYMVSLEQLESGTVKLLLVISMTWASDIGAYLIGRMIGKHHMLPLVSPKKTWEGYVGGIVFSIGVAIAAETFIPAIDTILDIRQIIVLALMISTLCPIGDFGESMLKRSFNIKDSSNLIPGHGGFLDRFDSIFWALPIGYYFFEMISLGFV